MSDEIDFKEFGIRPPEENLEDFIQKLILAGQTIIAPGGNVIDLLGQFITPQLERSRREWEFQVWCALKDLDKRQNGILKKLYQDRLFQSREINIPFWKFAIQVQIIMK